MALSIDTGVCVSRPGAGCAAGPDSPGVGEAEAGVAGSAAGQGGSKHAAKLQVRSGSTLPTVMRSASTM
jgi:hypothetical protein